MSLKAILFDFNGVIINDEGIHRQLIDDLLLRENLRPSTAKEYQQLCLGRNDYESLQNILTYRGRVVSSEYLTKLVTQKSEAYCQLINQMEQLPLYQDVIDFITKIQSRELTLALVTGALIAEAELILTKANIRSSFSVIVGGDEISQGKPHPESYLLALQRLNQENPDLVLQPSECLVIEDTPAGIEAGQNASMQVVGVAHTYPFHMLQRQADWCVDFLTELDLDHVEQVLASV
jgi:HAD superfamily hydrolase (TIGR01509 family)